MPRRSRRPKPPVEYRGSGRFAVRIGAEEARFIVDLLGQLRSLLVTAEPGEPRLRRLFPAAYHADAERDAEYQRLMRDELVAMRLSGIDEVESMLATLCGSPDQVDGAEAGSRGDGLGDGDVIELSEAELDVFARALNSLRLVIGTLIDIGELDDPTTVPDDHPFAGEHHLYAWLSWLLEWSIGALSDAR
jgi:hypothetical protein